VRGFRGTEADCVDAGARFVRSRGLRLLVLCAAAAPLGACTSVSWTGDDGVVHHLGLVRVVESESLRGSSVRVTSLGGELRVGGPNAGYCLGLGRTEYSVPRDDRAADGDELADKLLEFLAHTEPAPTRVSSSLFYATERLSPHAAAFEHSVAGLEVSARDADYGVAVGLASSERLAARARADGIVFCRLTSRNGRDTDESILLRLEPARPEEGGPP